MAFYNVIIIKNTSHVFVRKCKNIDCMLWGCLCNKLISSFLSLLSFNWGTISRRVAACWWRQWAKIQVWTNQNSRNNWNQIVTRTAWYTKLARDIFANVIIFPFINRLVTFSSVFFFTAFSLLLFSLLLIFFSLQLFLAKSIKVLTFWFWFTSVTLGL